MKNKFNYYDYHKKTLDPIIQCFSSDELSACDRIYSIYNKWYQREELEDVTINMVVNMINNPNYRTDNIIMTQIEPKLKILLSSPYANNTYENIKYIQYLFVHQLCKITFDLPRILDIRSYALPYFLIHIINKFYNINKDIYKLFINSLHSQMYMLLPSNNNKIYNSNLKEQNYMTNQMILYGNVCGILMLEKINGENYLNMNDWEYMAELLNEEPTLNHIYICYGFMMIASNYKDKYNEKQFWKLYNFYHNKFLRLCKHYIYKDDYKLGDDVMLKREFTIINQTKQFEPYKFPPRLKTDVESNSWAHSLST